MRIRLDSLGCRLNIGEMESLARRLAAAGHRVVGPGEAADLCILNTCTVTATAARKSRHLLRRLRRANPDAKLVVTGCWSELAPERAAATGADIVVGNADKDDLASILTERGEFADGDPVPAPDDPALPRAPGALTRAFVKVQDGCDNRCTFCIVTVARGAGRSRTVASVVSEIRSLMDAGYREVVLSGVHLGSYGRDLDRRTTLEALVRALLETTGVERLRLSSIEPWDIAPSFFALFADPRLLPHLHLPVQSGCDVTLRRMARRTGAAEIAELVAAARAAHSDMSVTTDVMVGFPGETDAEYEASFAFIERMAFARLHVFRYSPRPGTPAATMPGQVPGPVAQERSRRMHELGARLERRFQERFVGRTMSVLWEEGERHDLGVRWNGLTGNYIRVVADAPSGLELANRVAPARLRAAVAGAAAAVLVGPPAVAEARAGAS